MRSLAVKEDINVEYIKIQLFDLSCSVVLIPTDTLHRCHHDRVRDVLICYDGTMEMDDRHGYTHLPASRGSHLQRGSFR